MALTIKDAFEIYSGILAEETTDYESLLV